MDTHLRALRRAHLARYKAKARKLYPWNKQATNANHLAVCSCPVCGNPRKHFNDLTMQEKKQLESMKFQIQDL